MSLSYITNPKITINESDYAFIKFSGKLDGFFDVSKFIDTLDHKRLIIDTQGIDKMNSVGIAAWLDFLEKIHEKNFSLYFINCSYEIIRQKGIIDKLIPKTPKTFLLSFYLNYNCDNCETSKTVKYTSFDVKDLPKNAIPVAACDDCSAPLECDEIEDQFYQAFFDLKKSLFDEAVVSKILEL